MEKELQEEFLELAKKGTEIIQSLLFHHRQLKEDFEELRTENKRIKSELAKWERPFDQERLDVCKDQASHGDSLAAQRVYIIALEHALKQKDLEIAVLRRQPEVCPAESAKPEWFELKLSSLKSIRHYSSPLERVAHLRDALLSQVGRKCNSDRLATLEPRLLHQEIWNCGYMHLGAYTGPKNKSIGRLVLHLTSEDCRLIQARRERPQRQQDAMVDCFYTEDGIFKHRVHPYKKCYVSWKGERI